MSLPVVLRREARVEFDAAADAYEAERPGLGAEFTGQVQATLDRVAAMPELPRLVFGDIRRGRVRRFPYHVMYRVEPAQVVVIAVIHAHRDPKAWQSRA